MKCGKPYRKKTPIITKASTKANAPPSNPDHQDVPHSLKEFVKLKRLALAESADAKKKKQKPNVKVDVEKPPSKVTPTPKQANSISLVSKPVVDVVRQSNITALKKKKQKKYQKLKDKRKLKKQQQKERDTIDVEENMKDLRKEEIKFGEVVHRPPQISVLPRKVTKTGFENRPGRKDDLLLKSILQNKTYKKGTRTPLTDKRKNLSVSDQRQLEIERQNAMLAYKNMKLKQSKIKNLDK